MSRVLHDYPDEQAARVLQNIARASPCGTRLYVIERHVSSADHGHHGILSLHMYLTHGTVERTEDQWYSLLESEAAGGWRVTSSVAHNDHAIMSVRRMDSNLRQS